MPTSDRVLPFLPNPRLRQAKAHLCDATQAGVRRLITMAPILGRTNPAGVPVVEHVMLNLIDAPPDNDGGQERPLTVREKETREAREHRCLMAMLRDMAGDLSAAS